jgi:putative tryptophan/tyrosine transport system substrate-binding protein
MIRRREFIVLLGSAAAAWPLAARAQQPPQKMLRVGTAQLLPRNRPQWSLFEQTLREQGYVEGSNLAIEYIAVDDRPESNREAVRELVRRKTDVILATGVEIALQSAVREAGETPIVMIAIDYDPLAKGYIKNLARPGGNVTGVVALQIELTRKRLQILKDAVPRMRGSPVGRVTSNAPPPFRMRSLRTVHLLAPQAVWPRPLSGDKCPSLMTYEAAPQMHRTRRQVRRCSGSERV